MQRIQSIFTGLAVVLAPSIPANAAYAQEQAVLDDAVITGSRIRRNPLNQTTAVMDISNATLEKSGLTNLGEILQDLPVTGSAPNARFNVSGNSGFSPDGTGIAAGAVQLSLRNLGAKRTLILVDGQRWVAGSSASGVPSAVDLNTIPDNIVQRIEILPDGASAVYGSDAIGGVVNIITNADYEGFKLGVQTGEYLSDDDGASSSISALWGIGNDTTHVVTSLSYTDEKSIETAKRDRSEFPNPDAKSCDLPNSNCSAFTPQGRIILGPNLGGFDLALNNGVLNDGGANIPQFDATAPFTGDFHEFSNADRYNYNAPGLNLLRTPSERTNIYAAVTHNFSESLRGIVKASYTSRKSATRAAPEPLCLGSSCGNPISENFTVSALNPYNPFGVDLSAANGNLEFLGRRPLESGNRRFFQDIDSYFISAGVAGDFKLEDRDMYWDLTASYGDNSGFQEKENSHSLGRLQLAMGDPAVCALVPNCVPFNMFGGQGPDGNG